MKAPRILLTAMTYGSFGNDQCRASARARLLSDEVVEGVGGRLRRGMGRGSQGQGQEIVGVFLSVLSGACQSVNDCTLVAG